MKVSLESLLGLVVMTFACYRVATMIAEDIGPWRIFWRFRERFPSGWQYDGICCVGCVGVWVSAVATVALTIAGQLENPLVTWLACAGGICFLNRLAPCP
jgi:hypothetical protein